MDASDGLALQVTLEVKFWTVLLLNVPVAVNCSVCPTAIEAVEGVTAMDVNVAGAAVTLRVTGGLLTPPSDAVMVTEPAVTPVASPLLMPASLLFEEVQAALVVRFCVLPSLKEPVAANCCVPPTAILADAGDTAIDWSTGDGVVDPLAIPERAIAKE
jgi:hypothetical protein